MYRQEQETGTKILVSDQQGNELELIEFEVLLDEAGFKVENRKLLRTPGGREARPMAGQEGKFVEEGSGKVFTRLKVTQPG